MGENSNYEEVEQNTPSPTVVKPSHDDALSEHETPVLGGQLDGYETNHETPSTIDQYSYQGNNCMGEEAEGQLLDMIPIQVSTHKWFHFKAMKTCIFLEYISVCVCVCDVCILHCSQTQTWKMRWVISMKCQITIQKYFHHVICK